MATCGRFCRRCSSWSCTCRPGDGRPDACSACGHTSNASDALLAADELADAAESVLANDDDVDHLALAGKLVAFRAVRRVA